MKDKDMEQMKTLMENLITKRYKPSFRKRIGWFFESFMNYSLILALIIFNPFTIILGGLIAIILILIL